MQFEDINVKDRLKLVRGRDWDEKIMPTEDYFMCICNWEGYMFNKNREILYLKNT